MAFKETTAKKLFDQLLEALGSGDAPEEQKSKLYLLLENRLGLTKTAIAASQPVTLKLDELQQLEIDINKINKGIPVQHILGKAWFYGYEFIVNKNVLIPRSETEELVHLIINENKKQGLRILDIGTGSGCIPVCLKLEMDSVEVYSMDISAEALEIAWENARCHNASVQFIHQDIFSEKLELPKVDILVSNPPYVPESEKENMQREVLNHDPRISLFVEDDDPLIFYRRIAELGRDILSEGGKLYFEIHERFGNEMQELLTEKAYRNITIVKDIHNKDRIITATL